MFESCQLIHEDGKTPPDMILRFLYATKLSGPWIDLGGTSSTNCNHYIQMFNEATPTATNNSISIDSINKAVKPLGKFLGFYQTMAQVWCWRRQTPVNGNLRKHKLFCPPLRYPMYTYFFVISSLESFRVLHEATSSEVH